MALSYDGLGRRVAMATVTGGVTSVSHYGWCGQALCQSRSATDAPLRRYFAEGEYDATQGALIYAPDQLGSARDVLAGGTGQTLAHFDYDPYGNPTAATGSHANWPDRRYAGLFYHPTSGLYLATHRAYDPALGRWLSRDPIGEQGGINLYGYVGGNPLTFMDPLGLWTISVGFSVYIGGGGWGVSGSAGIVADGNGNAGFYGSAAGGPTAGGGAVVSAGGANSTAPIITDLSGQGAGGTVAVGADGGVAQFDWSTGTATSNGQTYNSYGGQLGLGVRGGASSGPSVTGIICMVGPACNTPPSPPAPLPPC